MTQKGRIVRYLQEFGSITQLEAITVLGVMRLASRIAEIKKDGVPIVSSTLKVKNRYGETCFVKQYRIERKEGDRA